ncbi:MAG TPA: nitrate- and nitrite sensing domain-containing protein, partial [Streptosporangiaceae bacterium]|nr:nitrate- and nitrite sensing domain-containing protein [Streptosporangiaceae bacterium]
MRRRSVTSPGEAAGGGNSASPPAAQPDVPAASQAGPSQTGASPAQDGATGDSFGQERSNAAVSLATRGVTQRSQGPGSRFALSNWRVRWRLAAVIAVPTVTAAVLGIVQINSAFSSYQAYGRVQHLVQTNADVVNLAEAVEDERDLSAGWAASPGRSTAWPQYTTLKLAMAKTDSEVHAVEADAQGVGTSSGYEQSTVQDLQTLVSDVQNDLPRFRQNVAKTLLDPSDAMSAYKRIITDAAAFTNAMGNGANDAQLQSTAITLTALQRLENDESVERGYLFAPLNRTPDIFQQDEFSQLNLAFSATQAQQADFDSSTSVAEQSLLSDTVNGGPVDEARLQLARALDFGAHAPGQPLSTSNLLTNPQQWWTNQTAVINDDRQVAIGPKGLVGVLEARANALHSHWASVLLWTSVIMLLLLILVVIVSTTVARSLTRPLRKLRSDALEVAGHKLPDVVRRLSQSEGADEGLEIEPIGVASTDEIGEVARAFDQVHREAVRLAADEAMLRGNLNAMFINLSRRSQSLIERQLSLIDSLEQSEQDPGRLSSLFRLDHLATRMRRNSENLLVLAGHEVARRWSQPVPLVDVLRAAISEIEQYERVVLNVQPGIVVVGQAVNDVVHLVAEIVENATTFSPEDTQVYVSGQPLSSGGVLLDITDNGVGISDQEMAHANWRLDNPPVVDVAVSRRMGLFVVGRLAARHGVRVRLRHAQAGGLTALIWLPETVAAPEVAPPLGRLRKFEADDFGPAPSLSAPPASTASPSASAQASAAARIPRFSSPGGPSSPSFTPGSGADPDRADPLGPSAAPPSLPMRGAAGASKADTGSGLAGDTGSGGLRMPSFGGGQPPATREAQDPAAFDDDPFEAALRDRASRDMSGRDLLGSRDGTGRDGAVRDGAARDTDAEQDWDATRDWEAAGDWDSEPAADGTEPSAGDFDLPPIPVAPAGATSGFANGNGNGNGARSGEVTIPPASVHDQRLPIFDSLESDWFRRSGKSLTAQGMASATGPQPVQAQNGPQPVVSAAQPAAAWTSPADEGWRKAQIVATPAAGETTQAGLPKRVPRANLVPGSVGESERDSAPAMPARTA